jgi:hypothetical protein
MEVGEGVGKIQKVMNKKPLCKKKDDDPDENWECRIGNVGELPTPTAAKLNENMKKDKVFTPKDPKKIGSDWDLYACSQTAFPYQSHHLIPKMHLPKHDVCVWLTKKKPNKEWALKSSTNYDTDGSRNGLALPFASNTYQWKHTSNPIKKAAICNKMMQLTRRQLHQGSHTYTDYDYGEEDSLHEMEGQGYLGAVDQLLSMVSMQVLKHLMICDDCKKTDKKPRKVRPLERVVEAMYEVSAVIKTMIAARTIFVSERAAMYRKPGRGE